MQRWCTVLYWTGVFLGAAVIAYGLTRYFLEGSLTSLFIALAIILAGPVEDIAGRPGDRRSPARNACTRARLVDLATSVAFLLCLGLAVFCA